MRDASFGNTAGGDMATPNALDVADFGSDTTTGITFGGNNIDLVVRGDGDDRVNLLGFGLVGSQAYGGIYGGVTYNVYTDGTGNYLAVEDGVAVGPPP